MHLHAEENLVVRGVLCGDVAPEVSKYVVGRTALSNDLPVEPRIVVDIDNAAGTRSKASLDQRIVLHQVSLVDGTRGDVVRQELPANWETEDVETVVIDEVLHLSGTVCPVVLR